MQFFSLPLNCKNQIALYVVTLIRQTFVILRNTLNDNEDAENARSRRTKLAQVRTR